MRTGVHDIVPVIGMWGFYLWPRCGVCEHAGALVERARDLADRFRRVGRWIESRIDRARSLWPPSM
jgi:hypothetical protein